VAATMFAYAGFPPWKNRVRFMNSPILNRKSGTGARSFVAIGWSFGGWFTGFDGAEKVPRSRVARLRQCPCFALG
jgi:hypothetical protein